jgi:D-alanyl-D-alanine carboxypeptidase/D-alanyl-D-alanine-endopeptidase (penicillin-binding protein 4)
VRVRPALLALILAGAVACGGARQPPAPVPPAPPGAAPPLPRLQRDIASLLDAPELKRVSWGIDIRSLDRDQMLYARDPQKLLLPASNEKVITLAAAADLLGWDFSFATELAAVGPVDAGVLYGDLVVLGNGDPSIDDWDGRATALFRAWAAELKARGISAVTGRVVGDDNRLPDVVLGAGWAWDDLDRSFATATGALQFNQNTTRLTIMPGAHEGDPATAKLDPSGSGLDLQVDVRTSAPQLPPAIETRRGAASTRLEVRGSVPLGTPMVRNVSVFNPTFYFAAALRESLIASGIDVRGAAIDVDDLFSPPPVEPGAIVVTYRSPPLSALAVTMMKMSQNLYAETLLQAVGGAVAVRDRLLTWNVEDGSVAVADGSGLSRYNMATATAFVTILSRVYRDERLRGPFEASLPIAGRDGTLANRMKGTAAEGNARAKTGAFSNARGLSGYVRSADGESIVFSIMANNFGTTPDVIERAADAIVVTLAEFSRK